VSVPVNWIRLNGRRDLDHHFSLAVASPLHRRQAAQQPTSGTSTLSNRRQGGTTRHRRFKLIRNLLRALQNIHRFLYANQRQCRHARFLRPPWRELNPRRASFSISALGASDRTTMQDLEKSKHRSSGQQPASRSSQGQFVEIPVAEIRSLGFDWYPPTRWLNLAHPHRGTVPDVLRTLENRTRWTFSPGRR